MNYYNIELPILNADTEYYLPAGYGGVATVKGADISIMGKVTTTPDKTYFEVWVKVHGEDREYSLEDIHVKYGNLLQPVALMQQPLMLGFKTLHGSNIVWSIVYDDLSVHGNLWVCGNDYTPHRIESLKDSALDPWCVYKLDVETFVSTKEEPESPEKDMYRSESEVRFYCKCGAVSDKSMADIMCVSDEELDNINAILTKLKEYMTAHNIVMVYDDSDNKTRVYRNCGLPDGYSIELEDSTNGHPWSMEVPNAALRPTEEMLYDRITDCWTLQLNYKKPEPEPEEAN